MPVRAGSLNNCVDLQVKTNVPDGVGGHSEAWVTAINPYWVKITPLSGREAFEVGQRMSAVNYKVEGRYTPGISAATHRLVFGTRVFRIEAVINEMERNETLEFMCEESPAIPEQQP